MSKYLFEYNEQLEMFHNNEIIDGKTFKHEPCTKGFMPICYLDDELDDDTFFDFVEALRASKVPYPMMFKLINERILSMKKNNAEINGKD